MTLCLLCTTDIPASCTCELHLHAFYVTWSNSSFQAYQALPDRGVLAHRSITQLLCCHPRFDVTVNSQQHHLFGSQGVRPVCWRFLMILQLEGYRCTAISRIAGACVRVMGSLLCKAPVTNSIRDQLLCGFSFIAHIEPSAGWQLCLLERIAGHMQAL